jgi:hypothetical protein
VQTVEEALDDTEDAVPARLVPRRQQTLHVPNDAAQS